MALCYGRVPHPEEESLIVLSGYEAEEDAELISDALYEELLTCRQKFMFSGVSRRAADVSGNTVTVKLGISPKLFKFVYSEEALGCYEVAGEREAPDFAAYARLTSLIYRVAKGTLSQETEE